MMAAGLEAEQARSEGRTITARFEGEAKAMAVEREKFAAVMVASEQRMRDMEAKNIELLGQRHQLSRETEKARSELKETRGANGQRE